MRSEELLRVNIFARKDDKEDLLRTLQELGVLHIAPVKLNHKALAKDSALSQVEQTSSLLIRFRYICENLSLSPFYYLSSLPNYAKVLASSSKLLEELEPQVQQLSHEQEAITTARQRVLLRQEQLKALPQAIKLARDSSVTTRIFIAQKTQQLPKCSFEHDVKVITQKQKLWVYLRVHTSDLAAARAAFSEFRELDYSFIQGGSLQTLKALDKELSSLASQEISLAKRRKTLATTYQKDISYSTIVLENYRAQQLLPQHFAASKHFFIINAYVARKDLAAVQAKCDDLIIQEENVDLESAPTKLKNRGFAKFFEPLVSMYGLPKYGAIDPTPLLSFFFPFFFGFMLSDIGYGLLLLIATLGLWAYLGRSFKDAGMIFTSSALSSIFFGFVFGSFFGNLITITPWYADSFSASFDILKFSLLVGLIHINLAVILLIAQKIMLKRPVKEILFQGLAIPLMQATAVLIILGLKVPAIISAIVMLYVLISNNGFFGIMDITGLFGQWFSYARLLALSLATAGVALAINIIAQRIAQGLGGVGIVIAAVILIVGHLANFALNLLGCSVHAARLHYVEFFSLFYEGGGSEFDAFKLKETTQE